MVRTLTLTLAVGLVAPVFGAAQGSPAATATTTWTGWFSDKDCAAPRAARGDFRPDNPECVKRCLGKGAVPVFISEQVQAMFEVKDYASVQNDVGYRIELTGTVDEKAKAISVQSVKRLSYIGAMCMLPKRTPGKGSQPR